VVLHRRAHLTAAGQQIPHPIEADRHIALILRVVGIGAGQLFGGGQGGSGQGVGGGEVQPVADLVDEPQARVGEPVMPLAEPAGDGGSGNVEQGDLGSSSLLEPVSVTDALVTTDPALR
jgi:hypothetical protein